eukprot:7193338-Heterocapsa_arctica.AAC.1
MADCGPLRLVLHFVVDAAAVASALVRREAAAEEGGRLPARRSPGQRADGWAKGLHGLDGGLDLNGSLETHP